MLWITTYTLVLIGTVKYKYPLISPFSQAIIAPFEFAMFMYYICLEGFQFDYISVTYHYWTLVEVAIIYVIIKNGFIKKGNILKYLSLVAIITAFMFQFVAVMGWAFFFSYFCTFIGELFWFRFIFRKEYPLKPITLVVFIAKFVADAISIPVYFSKGNWIISVMCILLPLLDFLFIVVYFKKRRLRHAL